MLAKIPLKLSSLGVVLFILKRRKSPQIVKYEWLSGRGYLISRTESTTLYLQKHSPPPPRVLLRSIQIAPRAWDTSLLNSFKRILRYQGYKFPSQPASLPRPLFKMSETFNSQGWDLEPPPLPPPGYQRSQFQSWSLGGRGLIPL